jgi:hypothetical protein
MTSIRRISATVAIFALTAFGPQVSFAEDNRPVVFEKPKLNVGQFVSNCQKIGGTVSDAGAGSDGGRVVNCEKDNGLNVSCEFNTQSQTYCNGYGPRPQ